MEPSHLALFWAGVIAVAILAYVILDGFDLGVGILFGTTGDEALRDEMMEAIAPFWDGNETWLVVVGTSLFAAFPTAYAVFLPAFYIPVLLLLIGLIFRGVAFEFRHAGARGFWHRGFYLGSTVAAFVQGAAVGAMIRGIPVANGQYAGGPFEWLAPLPALCGIGLVFGYALLGAGWLVRKCEGALREWGAAPHSLARRRGAGGPGGGIPRDACRARQDRDRTWGLIFPVIGLAAMGGVLLGVHWRRDGLPFVMTTVFFVAAFLSLAVLFWPYMIPYRITVANAAAPDASLSFLFWGAVVVLPVIAIYTITVYWLFRGKLIRR
jgi:cytochrome bd ubiquinol oxidase subunit II